jgi:hypothetical protein
MDILAFPAIDGAQHTLAEPRGVLHDPVEHRLQIGRRVGDQAQDLGGRRLPLFGFLKFEDELCDFRFRAGRAGHAHGLRRSAALWRRRRAASRLIWSVA